MIWPSWRVCSLSLLRWGVPCRMISLHHMHLQGERRRWPRWLTYETTYWMLSSSCSCTIWGSAKMPSCCKPESKMDILEGERARTQDTFIRRAWRIPRPAKLPPKWLLRSLFSSGNPENNLQYRYRYPYRTPTAIVQQVRVNHHEEDWIILRRSGSAYCHWVCVGWRW